MNTNEKLINELTRFNLWRRGDDSHTPHPNDVGRMIDDAITALSAPTQEQPEQHPDHVSEMQEEIKFLRGFFSLVCDLARNHQNTLRTLYCDGTPTGKLIVDKVFGCLFRCDAAPQAAQPAQDISEREAFEAWFNAEYPDIGNPQGKFRTATVFSLMEMAWRARAKAGQVERQAVPAWISVDERLHPEAPGLKRYEQIPCLIIKSGEVLLRVWNCQHLVWDDEDGDDFYCEARDVKYWMLLPAAPTGSAK